MKRPAFQFYPADWRKDAALQSCSVAAQGLWINLLCIAHECEPYGHLTVNGKPMNPAQIGRLVGLSAKECAALLAELQDAGVSSVADDGSVYSRRMVRDERLREVRAQAGRLGGNPNLLNQKPTKEVTGKVNYPSKQSPTPSSSSSSSSSTSVNTEVGGAAQALAPPPPYLGDENEARIPPKARVQLAPAWELPAAWGADAEALGFTPQEILFQAEKFRQYWVSGKGSGTRRGVKGWRQSWSNWLGNVESIRRVA